MTNTLPVGSNNIVAMYTSGDGNFSGSSGTATQMVTKATHYDRDVSVFAQSRCVRPDGHIHRSRITPISLGLHRPREQWLSS